MSIIFSWARFSINSCMLSYSSCLSFISKAFPILPPHAFRILLSLKYICCVSKYSSILCCGISLNLSIVQRDFIVLKKAFSFVPINIIVIYFGGSSSVFNKIIGNEEIQNLLKQAIKNNRTSHSYLFVGTEGIGKKQIAKEFAKALLCLNNDKYCNTCKSCIEFDDNNNPDFVILEPDENSIKIEQIREIHYKSSKSIN